LRHIAACPLSIAPRRSLIVQLALAGSIEPSVWTMSTSICIAAAFSGVLRMPWTV
jgi:hypothetical protein